ncbi:MAG: GNAT family N-acetyltransferase [Clostridia bacterium]|nr:GNAT family N-acetyltransferase [Clostridia bacterium]
MIRLVPVRQEDHDLLFSVNQKYLYEMTAFYPDEMDAQGNYHYGYFEDYFVNPQRKAFFLHDDDTFVGFAMVNPYSNIGETTDHTLAEFTVFPAFRRRHYAREAARLILDTFPGRWEIKYNEKNAPAKALWTAVAAPYRPAVHRLNDEETVFAFDTRTK